MKNFEKNFFFWLNLCQYRIISVNTRRIKSTFRVMKRYIIIKCPKFSKLSFDNILGVKDTVPNFSSQNVFFVTQYPICICGRFTYYVYVRVFDKKIYLEEYDLDIFKIYLWWICFIFFGGTSLTLVYLA